jgi:hypothetical protein
MKDRSIAALIGVLILGSMLGLGCGGLIRSITEMMESAVLSPRDIRERYMRAVVRIDVYMQYRLSPGGVVPVLSLPPMATS